MTASGGDSKASSSGGTGTEDTWITRSVRRSTLRRSVAGFLAVVAVVALSWSQRRYIVNFVGGPYSVGAAELDRIRDVSLEPRYFVRVTSADVSDTGVTEVAGRKYKNVEVATRTVANYYALRIGDRALLCKSSSGSSSVFEGRLVPISPALEAVVGTRAGHGLGARYYPFYVDDSFRGSGYFAIFGLLIFLILLVCYALPAWWWLKHPAKHPVIRRVRRWGELASVSARVEQQTQKPPFDSDNGWFLTEEFVVRSTFFGFQLFRLTDLLWAYKKVTKRSWNFIPTSQTHAAMLAFASGTAELSCHQGMSGVVDGMLAFAMQRAPWAERGFSDELQDRYATEPAAFAARVKQRRQELEQNPPASGKASAAAGPLGFGELGELDVKSDITVSLAMAMTGGQQELRVRAAKGKGHDAMERRVRINIPPGIDDGQRMRIPKLGLPGPSGRPPGDLYVDVTLAANADFQRNGDDLETRISISRQLAADGGETDIVLPDGSRIRVKIPAGIGPDARLRVAGRGMPRLDRSGRGDLYATLDLGPLH